MTKGGHMNGPDDDLRTRIASRPLKTEREAEDALAEVLEFATGDSYPSDDPEQDLAAIESWASVASYVVARCYGPQSPLRPDFAGWSKGAADKLRRVAAALLDALRAVGAALQAAQVTISVGFPWGVSIGLTW
jgi:hypothetical protein